MVIPLGRQLPGASSGLTRELQAGRPSNSRAEPVVVALLFDLAPGGVYRASSVTRAAGELLPHRFTLTPTRGRFVFCGTVRGISPLGVTQHPALWSPDFPLTAIIAASDHPPLPGACQRTCERNVIIPGSGSGVRGPGLTVRARGPGAAVDADPQPLAPDPWPRSQNFTLGASRAACGTSK